MQPVLSYFHGGSTDLNDIFGIHDTNNFRNDLNDLVVRGGVRCVPGKGGGHSDAALDIGKKVCQNAAPGGLVF